MASNKQTLITRPTARSEELLVQHVESETVVYDERVKTSHALRPLAAAVFMYADGNNTVEEIAELAGYRLDQAVTVDDVNEALTQLEASDLLDAPAGILSAGISRRTALKTFAAAGAGTMLVSSIVAPFASATTLTNFGIPYTCNWVGSGNNPYMLDSGNTYSGNDPKAQSTLTPNGWAQPYAQTSGSSFEMAATGAVGGPEDSGDWYLSHSCIAAINTTKSGKKTTTTTVYGTYQVVPCDGDPGADQYSCADVVCVPTSNGNSINASTNTGTQTPILGAITSIGTGNGTKFYNNTSSSFAAPGSTANPAYGPYNDYAYNNDGYYFKVCCGNGIDKGSGGTCDSKS